MHRIILVVLCATIVRPLTAQWRATLAYGIGSGAHDATSDADADHAEFHADQLRSWRIGIDRQAGHWQFGIDLRRTAADLAEDGAETAVVARDALHSTTLALNLGRLLARTSGDVSLWFGASGRLVRWTFDLDGGSPEWRPAAGLTLEADVPVSHHWQGFVRGEYTIGAEAFGADELPEDFTPRTARRAELYIGLALRP